MSREDAARARAHVCAVSEYVSSYETACVGLHSSDENKTTRERWPYLAPT